MVKFKLNSSLKYSMILFKIRQILLKEKEKNYYSDITNISEVIDINTHICHVAYFGVYYIHVENLVIWQNGFYNFNCFNFPIPASVRNKDWSNSSIISKKLVYSVKCK